MVVYLRVLERLAELEPPVEWRRRMLASIRNALTHGHISAVSEELELDAQVFGRAFDEDRMRERG